MALVGGTLCLFFALVVFRVYVSGCGASKILVYL